MSNITSFDLSTLNLKMGTYSITVKAKASGWKAGESMSLIYNCIPVRFTIDNRAYGADKNTTWKTWMETNSPEGLRLTTSTIEDEWGNVLCYSYVPVNINTYIEPKEYKMIFGGDIAETSEFYINSENDNFTFVVGMTWEDFLNSDYNDGNFVYDEAMGVTWYGNPICISDDNLSGVELDEFIEGGHVYATP